MRGVLDPSCGAGEFLSTPEFARRVGISERKACKAAQRCAEGGTWRGVRLEVRLVAGRGGRGGLAYQVAASSIPPQLLTGASVPALAAGEASSDLTVPEIGEVLPPLPPPMPRSRVSGGEKAQREADWKSSIIAPIRHETKRGTAERAAMIRAVAAQSHADWRGRTRWFSESTIRDLIGRYDRKSLEGLRRKKRADAGCDRVIFSRKFDRALRAAGASEAQITEITKKIVKRVRSEWRSGTPSWPTIQMNSLPLVVELARRAGLALPPAEMHCTCQVPRSMIEEGRPWKNCAMKRNDAAAWHSTRVPRISRDRSHLRPMEWVAADIHHLDLSFRRPGKKKGTCTPKIVAWLDLATNRGEFNWAGLVDDLAKLKHVVGLRSAYDLQNDLGWYRSLPGEPQSKVIENFFAAWEREAIAQLPGFIGGDRMRKKTQKKGKDPAPFDGDESKLRRDLDVCVRYYHAKPQSKESHLAGESPSARFAALVKAGWTPTLLRHSAELAVVFSDQLLRQVDTGGILHVDGAEFHADALAIHAGRKVIVRRPLYGNLDRLFVFDEFGKPLAIALLEQRYAFGDPRGAAEQARRNAVLNAQAKALEAETEPVDSVASMEASAELLLHPAAVKGHALISVSPEYAEMARMAKEQPAAAPSKKLGRQREQFALIEKLAGNG